MTSPQEIRGQRSDVRGQKAVGGKQNAELDNLIEEAYFKGVDAHGDLGITLGQFAEHVDSIVTKGLGVDPADDAVRTSVARIRADDFYLAAACAYNSHSAWSRLAALYDNHIRNVAHALCSTHQEARDLANDLIGHLYLTDCNGRRRIATYEGRGSLRTWLAAIIKHQAMNKRELKSNEAVPLDSLRDTPGVSADSELDAALIHSKHQEAIADSFRCAVESLTARERLVLLLRVEDELAAAEIARRFGVHKAQITRTIQRAENKLRMVLFTRLGTHHGLGREAMEECAAHIIRNPETSLAAFLRARAS